MNDVLSKLILGIEQYIDASEGHLCDSDYELDGYLSETHAKLKIVLIPAAKAYLEKLKSE